MNLKNRSFLQDIDLFLGAMTLFAVTGEFLFFPSLANSLGCFMVVVSYFVFRIFLKRKYIVRYPFAFFMYLSMFLYHFLPLISTLVEGKPISFGFEVPLETFTYEILLFFVFSLAFYWACITSRLSGNNLITKNLERLHFFDYQKIVIWGIGVLGLIIQIYNFKAADDVNYGDVVDKFLMGMNNLMYAPLIFYFPSLLNRPRSKRSIFLIIYIVLLFFIGVASNGRRNMITPFGIIVILLFLYLVKSNKKLTEFISPVKIGLLIAAFFFGINLLTNFSMAMLYARHSRADVSKAELLQQTIDTYRNKTLMTQLKSLKEGEAASLQPYSSGWTEYYLDNFMLNRYANMRISDETLYYAEKRGYGNSQMYDLFIRNIFASFPTPLLSLVGINLNKTDLAFSRGDYLSGSSLGGFRVTSHIGDGLATFGYIYFLIQFIFSFLVFKLLNCFVLIRRDQIVYAPFALLSVFVFLGMFRNANGVIQDVQYCIRGFWQGIFIYLIVYLVLNFIFRLFCVTKNKSREIYVKKLNQ